MNLYCRLKFYQCNPFSKELTSLNKQYGVASSVKHPPLKKLNKQTNFAKYTRTFHLKNDLLCYFAPVLFALLVMSDTKALPCRNSNNVYRQVDKLFLLHTHIL